MRLVSYNILDGGEGRADPLAEVILAQRPDIVAIVEADNLATIERIADRLHMDFLPAPCNKSAAALLTRWKISRSINHALLARSAKLEKSFVEVTLTDPSNREWTIGVVHLHAHATKADERTREKEIAIVLDAFADRRAAGGPHLLVGDFNSNSPHQKIERSNCKSSTQKEIEKNGGVVPRKVVQMILDAGYVDSLRSVDASTADSTGTFSTQHPGQRVDYIFAFGDLRITDAWIECDRLAKYASDHFPVGVEID